MVLCRKEGMHLQFLFSSTKCVPCQPRTQAFSTMLLARGKTLVQAGRMSPR